MFCSAPRTALGATFQDHHPLGCAEIPPTPLNTPGMPSGRGIAVRAHRVPVLAQDGPGGLGEVSSALQ